jgi:hypothetical protein
MTEFDGTETEVRDWLAAVVAARVDPVVDVNGPCR